MIDISCVGLGSLANAMVGSAGNKPNNIAKGGSNFARGSKKELDDNKGQVGRNLRDRSFISDRRTMLIRAHVFRRTDQALRATEGKGSTLTA